MTKDKRGLGQLHDVDSKINKLGNDPHFSDFKNKLNDILSKVSILDKDFLNFDNKNDTDSKNSVKKRQEFSSNAKSLLNKGVENFKIEFDIKESFPKQTEEMEAIFKELKEEQDKAKQQSSLKSIADKLGLDAAKMSKYLQLEPSKKEEKVIEKLQPKKLESIKTTKEVHQEKEDGVRSLESLLSILAKDQKKDNVDDLEKKHSEVKEYYKNWQDKNENQINDWAKEKKSKLTKDEICEAIAIVDRANKIVTGHNLRDTQILSVLTFLNTEGNQGKLCQIKTGEGKTTIVSILAAIKVLQGEAVDIITSNQVLAREGIEDRVDFYTLLNISVSHNNIDQKYKGGPKEPYTADVLYGCISNFQFDYLRDSFKGLKTRADRKFDNVILDEVDNMIIDNASHIAKLSQPFPGMECFRYIYYNIWKKLCEAEKKVLSDDLTPTQEQINKIKEIVKSEQNLIDIDFFATNDLKKYAENKLDIWIEKAMHAKFYLNENQDYILQKNSSYEELIVPVDYINTGVTLKNTVWSMDCISLFN
jgi:hypothetical protein